MLVRGVLFFEDDSGTTVLEMNLPGAELKPGQRIRLAGTNYVAFTDAGLSLGAAPVVDANYLHPTIERSGEIYLQTGRYPIRVVWFNRTSDYLLRVEYSGPHLSRQTIPDSMLFQSATNNSDGKLRPACAIVFFEGQWDKVPDFNALMPQRTGVVPNFDLAIKSRDENVGLDFTGFLEVVEAGLYRFYLSSDDGSQLFLDETPPVITILGTTPVPASQRITVSQLLPVGPGGLWAEIEGTITFISRSRSQVEFELSAGEKKMRAEMLGASSEIPWYLLNSRVRVRGICPSFKNNDGQNCAGDIGRGRLAGRSCAGCGAQSMVALKKATIGELNRRFSAGDSGTARLQGHVRFDPETQDPAFGRCERFSALGTPDRIASGN